MKSVGRAALVFVAALGLGGFLAASSVSALAAASVPYTDSSAVGTIELCDQKGQPLTHGSVYDKPFIWKAVDATAAPTAYAGTAAATLYAYQPRSGVDPHQWSGSQLSGAAIYTTPAHPTAAMTGLDESLAAFLAAYPPQWDGLVQLRIYLTAPNQPLYSVTYDATNIKVSGSTWSVVDATSVSCTSGSAVSREQVLATDSAVAASLSAQTTVAPSKSQPNGQSGTHASQSSGSVPGGVSGQAPAQAAGVASSALAASAPATESAPPASVGASTGHAGSSSDTLLLILVGVGVVGVAFVGIQWLRSRA